MVLLCIHIMLTLFKFLEYLYIAKNPVLLKSKFPFHVPFVHLGTRGRQIILAWDPDEVMNSSTPFPFGDKSQDSPSGFLEMACK